MLIKNFKKISAVVIMILFVMLVFSPNVISVNSSILKKQSDLLEIEIEEYKSDGNVEKKVFKLSKTDVTKLRNDLLNVRNLDEQLQILKEYNLIEKDQTVEDLEEDMYKKAADLGITSTVANKRLLFRFPFLLKLFTCVTGVYLGGFSFKLGTEPIARIINKIAGWSLPRVDLFDICGALFGVLNTRGIFMSHTFISIFTLMGMIGFVGYGVKFPFAMHIFMGFSAVTFSYGIGFHLRNFVKPDINL